MSALYERWSYKKKIVPVWNFRILGHYPRVHVHSPFVIPLSSPQALPKVLVRIAHGRPLIEGDIQEIHRIESKVGTHSQDVACSVERRRVLLVLGLIELVVGDHGLDVVAGAVVGPCRGGVDGEVRCVVHIFVVDAQDDQPAENGGNIHSRGSEKGLGEGRIGGGGDVPVKGCDGIARHALSQHVPSPWPERFGYNLQQTQT